MPAMLLERDELHRGYIDLDKHEIRNVLFQNLAADPATPSEGQFFYRTDTKKVRYRTDTGWQDLATMADVTAGGISSAIVDLKGDLLTATGPDTIVREPVGADGTFYVAASGQTTGHQWRGIVDADIPATITRDTEAQGMADAAQAFSIQRANHTGSQAISTVTGLQAALDGKEDDGAAAAAAAAAQAFAVQRANHTGTQAAATISDFNTAVRTNRLDQMAAPTAAVPLNGQKITGLADGTAATDAATFGQLSAAIQGFDWKEPVRIVLTGNDTLTGLAARDGVTPVAGDRVLAIAQTTTANNGIYVAAAGAWTRAEDADSNADITNATVFVEAGTNGAGDVYTQTGTTLAAQTWIKSAEGNTVYSADGTTLTLTGTTFGIAAGGVTATQLAASVAGNGLTGGAGTALSVNTGTGLEISGDAVRIAAAAAGDGLTGGAGSALAVGAGNGISVTADAVAVDPAVVVRKATGVLAGGANTEVETHGLNTRLIDAFLLNPNSPWDRVDVYYEATTVNTVTFYAASGNVLPAGYNYVVMG